jgi:anthranilate synthase component 1
MFIRSFPDKARYRELAGKFNVVPVCTQVLADLETPVSLLMRIFDRKKPCFLLESVEGGERWGRYSFLGINARTTIRVYRNHLTLETNGDVERRDHGGDALGALRKILDAFNPAHMPDLPRFYGGLVGYMSYEMVEFFEKIPNRFGDDDVLAEFVIPDILLAFDNVQHTLTSIVLTFPDGDANIDEVFAQARQRSADIFTTLDRTAPPAEPAPSDKCYELKSTCEEEAYRERVRTVKQHIVDGDVIQAVISQAFVCDAPDDLPGLYRAQRYINPSPYMYFMHTGATTLIGASPETMVRMEGRNACVRPIAGTRKRGATEQEDRMLADELLGDEKERAEHLMLVDLGRNDLGRLAQVGTVQVTDLMVVERYSHVMHLVSNVVCRMRDGADAFDLIRATFPAGTLSGAPKVRAMEIIAEQEHSPRGPYGGAVGYIGFDGNMDMAITIRTATVTGNQLTVRAGAGIVYDSDPERERMECVHKSASVQRALAFLAEGHK